MPSPTFFDDPFCINDYLFGDNFLTLVEYIISGLNQSGFCVIPNAVPAAFTKALI